jgi:hypothetical protein
MSRNAKPRLTMETKAPPVARTRTYVAEKTMSLTKVVTRVYIERSRQLNTMCSSSQFEIRDRWMRDSGRRVMWYTSVVQHVPFRPSRTSHRRASSYIRNADIRGVRVRKQGGR